MIYQSWSTRALVALAFVIPLLPVPGAASEKAELKVSTEVAAKLAPTLWLAREAGMLGGQAPQRAAVTLRHLLKTDWNVTVTCGDAQFIEPSSPRCMIGLRQLARAFYDGELTKFDPAVAEVLHLDISEDDAPRVSTTESKVRIHLPYAGTRAQFVDFIAGVTPSRAVRKRVGLMAQYKDARDTWVDMDLAKLEFDPKVGIADRWRTLRNLIDLASEDDDVFKRPGEAIYVTTRFLNLFERHLQAQEAIKATASLSEIREFLIEAKRETPATVALQSYIDAARDNVRAIGQSIETRTGWKFDCSDKDTLTLSSCLRTLKRVDFYIKRKPSFRPAGKLLLIAGRGELESELDMFEVPGEHAPVEVFAVREGFDLGRFDRFARDYGWLSGPPVNSSFPESK